MKRIFVLAAALAATASLNAQLHEKIVIKAGDNVAEAVSPNGFYRLPQFTDGIFTLKNGTKARARFNYHIGNGEMEYISQKGDTMAVGVPDDLELITIGEDVQYIYNNKAYLEIIADRKPAMLAKKIRIIVENDRKGGYGESAPASSQINYKNFTLSTGLLQLTHDLSILKTTSYFWLDDKHNPQPATKKNLLRLMSKDKQAKLEAFIDENKINFNNEDDLRKVLYHAETL